jgi:membrane protein required for colicin V production
MNGVERMAVYDMLMLVVLASATIFGVIKGFAWQVASLASIVVSYFVAYNYRNDIASRIDAQYPWNIFLGMLLAYAGVSFAIWIVFRLVSGTIDKVRLKEFDRHLGAVFGFGKGVLLCIIITMFAMTLLDANKQQAICHSRSGYYISKILANADGLLPAEVDQVVGPLLARLEEQLQARRSNSPNIGGNPNPDVMAGNSGQVYDWRTNGSATLPTPVQPEQSGLSNWLTSGQAAVFPNAQSLPAPNSILPTGGGQGAEQYNWPSTSGGLSGMNVPTDPNSLQAQPPRISQPNTFRRPQ